VLYQQRETERLLFEANAKLEERIRERTEQLEYSNQALRTEIEERREIERELRESKTNLQAILENAEDSIWSVDANYCLLVGNPVFQRNTAKVFGRPLLPGESVLGHNLPTDVFAEWKCYYDRALTGEHFIVEQPSQLLPSRMMEYRFDPIHAEDGEIIGVIVFNRDVTEQWRIKEALGKSEEKYRRLFDNAQIGMYRTRLDGAEVLEINDRMAQMVQKPKAEIVGKPTLLNWADPEKRAALVSALQENGHVTAFEMPALVGDGTIHTLLLSVTAYPDENLLEGTAADITERKAMEDALRESERRMTDLLHNLPGIAYRSRNDTLWTMEFLSEGVEALTGYTAEELMQNRRLSFVELIELEDRPMVWDMVQAALAADRSYQVVYRIRTATGEQKWVWEQGAAVRGEDGSVVALEGFIGDITELKVAQEAIRLSEMRFRSLFEASSIGTALVAADGQILQANPALGRFLQCEPAHLTGKSIADVTHPDDFAADAKLLALLLTDEIPSYTIEKRYITCNSEVVWGLLTASIVRDLDGAPVFLIGQVQDISERRAVQAELEQLYRRAEQDAQEKSVLLNEINHRVKNNMVAILGLLLAEQQFAPSEQRILLEAYFENVARRIKGLIEVHRMLSDATWIALLLDELVAQIIRAGLDALALGERVRVTVTPSPVQVAPRQASNLSIVINELLANSLKHASSQAESLRIDVAITEANEDIRIIYRDNGNGYPARVVEGVQQGVGLYLVRRIVERTLRGRLVLANDHGAVADITIPIADTVRT